MSRSGPAISFPKHLQLHRRHPQQCAGDEALFPNHLQLRREHPQQFSGDEQLFPEDEASMLGDKEHQPGDEEHFPKDEELFSTDEDLSGGDEELCAKVFRLRPELLHFFSKRFNSRQNIMVFLQNISI